MKSKTIVTKRRSAAVWAAWAGGRRALPAKGHERIFWRYGNALVS